MGKGTAIVWVIEGDNESTTMVECEEISLQEAEKRIAMHQVKMEGKKALKLGRADIYGKKKE